MNSCWDDYGHILVMSWLPPSIQLKPLQTDHGGHRCCWDVWRVAHSLKRTLTRTPQVGVCGKISLFWVDQDVLYLYIPCVWSFCWSHKIIENGWEGHVKSGGILSVNTLMRRQNGWHFTEDIFQCIFLNDDIWILIYLALKFVPKSQIKNITALVHLWLGAD